MWELIPHQDNKCFSFPSQACQHSTSGILSEWSSPTLPCLTSLFQGNGQESNVKLCLQSCKAKRYFLFPSEFLWIKVFKSLWEICTFPPTVNLSSYCVKHLIGFVKEEIYPSARHSANPSCPYPLLLKGTTFSVCKSNRESFWKRILFSVKLS